MNSVIDLEKFAALTVGSVIGHTIKYVDSTPSTMSLARSYVENPPPQAPTLSGTIFVADEQTEGRARRNRNWEAPHGEALLVSVIIQRPHLPSNPAYLAMIAGLATARAIERSITVQSGAMQPEHVRLKWPNDLLLALADDSEPEKVNPSMGKVAGVLVESVIQQNELQYATIGVGINVNQVQNELPPPPFGAPKPTSIRLYLGKAINRTELLAHLCEELSRLLAMHDPAEERIRAEQIYCAWRSRLDTLDKQVSIYEFAPELGKSNGHTAVPPPTFSGVAVDVTADGDLVIEDDQGCRRSFNAGDVSVRY